jgi:hypothetical protein
MVPRTRAVFGTTGKIELSRTKNKRLLGRNCNQARDSIMMHSRDLMNSFD